ncbi:cell division/cell wall cluster transcriptional repressor MraZ [Candidatus Giovannonibacteria bacterium RIFCSPHIGHO2_02_43_13]|uniref:Transcriptional regulator MraZ n=1 Tax=Candidatus Giovannonibacteria bacterium RIFCSPHIGHO2_02_43_13 TaxID=1798330 RepID=A0A1F5WSB2_9BACT|nr:MAG: Protein MraZ [Parcubacteria group bacterium GW2011_GWA2_44_13]OGF74656.1 MAG: cell division/cell wall cluster transcriptional repressor MraZ [Candidatus Giovannonibacteria bacterium RIFCSPHIGHO2_12_FULL_44_42]OGF78211.1 MAG: cell division/cell wall cluster transcriptional repressor MraZ [Candidatus Giovannonibacteria bacterium RIFCSPHIGHO2_02_43_13]OGF90077.1 MAG: cell division/cell wall cluster transcriptional repressor MraZ [Candidatus Giovannonibacteria bacterium RIFCSPLOWO2_02_FULL_4
MLIGEYLHTIDNKNRLSVPSKFRKELGKTVILTRGLDKCLFLYPVAEWKVLADKLAKLPLGKSDTRSFVRTMIAGATDIEIDALGRILLPDYLKVYGNLKEAAMVVGLYKRVEIWSPELWQTYSENASNSVEKVAEKLGEAGLY